MTTTQPEPAPAAGLSMELERFYPVTPERLFAFFTEAEHLRRWWGPRGCPCPEAEVDLRVGGAYRLVITTSDGGEAVTRGRYVEIEAPTRLVFTWAWEGETGDLGEETLVTLTFAAAEGGATVHLRHERFPSKEAADNHRGGWSSALDCLGELFPDHPRAQETEKNR